MTALILENSGGRTIGAAREEENDGGSSREKWLLHCHNFESVGVQVNFGRMIWIV